MLEVISQNDGGNTTTIAIIGSIIGGGEGNIASEVFPPFDPQGHSLTGHRQIYSAPAAISQYQQTFSNDATELIVRIGADIITNFAWCVALPGIGGVHKSNGNEGTHIPNFNPTAHHLLGDVDQTVTGVTPSTKNATPTINSDMNWAAYKPGAQYHAIGHWNYGLGNAQVSDFTPWTTFLQHECLNLHGSFDYPVIPRTVAEWEEWIQDCKKPQYFFIPVALGYLYSLARALPNGRLNGSPLTIRRTRPWAMKDLIVVDSAESGWVPANSGYDKPRVSVSVIVASVSPEEQRYYKRGAGGNAPDNQMVFMRHTVSRSLPFTAQKNNYVPIQTQEVLMGGYVLMNIIQEAAAEVGLGMGETGAGGNPMVQSVRQSAAGSKSLWELGDASVIKGEFSRFRGFKPQRFSNIVGWTYTPELELYLEQHALVGGSINFSMFTNYTTEIVCNELFHGQSMRLEYMCDFLSADVFTSRTFQVGTIN